MDPLQGILTRPLCTGELSCYDPGECSDGHQGPYVQEWSCALCVRRGRRDRGLKDRSRLSGHQHAADCLYLQDRQSCLHLSAEGGLWEFLLRGNPSLLLTEVWCGETRVEKELQGSWGSNVPVPNPPHSPAERSAVPPIRLPTAGPRLTWPPPWRPG